MRKIFVSLITIMAALAVCGAFQPAAALVEIPAGATVVSATLSLYVDAPSSNTVNVHQVNAEWTENGVSWNTRPDFNPTVIDTFVTDDIGWRSADVTALVQNWVDGVPNFGFLLEQGLTSRSRYFSSEIANVSLRPTLEISYYTTDSASVTDVTMQRLGSEQEDVMDTYVSEMYPDTNMGDLVNLYTGLGNNKQKQTLIRYNIETVVLSFCGDGNTDEGEACDDGNNDNGDGCSANCTIEPFCGDGNMDMGEECDDGNIVDGDGCSSSCTIEHFCGDGNIDEGEVCDDGNMDSGDGCSANCTIEPFCGDGNMDEGEACDDGNNDNGDGCSASCAIEPFCGDGNMDMGEECDDGNIVDGDGCSSSCTIEPFCGDGNMDESETCDDGNNEDGDGCSADCRIEEACNECDGKVTQLTLQYNGNQTAVVRVEQKDGDIIFEGSVNPGQSFTFTGTETKGKKKGKGNSNNSPTMGTEITLYVDGALHTAIHTSCSQPIGPGTVKGDFLVVEAYSLNGGLICADPDSDTGNGDGCSECDGKVTELTLQYNGGQDALIRVEQKDGDIIFEGNVASGTEFAFSGTETKGKKKGKGNSNNSPTMGTEITLYVDGIYNTAIHTSCSQPIGPGTVKGDFLVIEAYSLNGGLICADSDMDNSDTGKGKKGKDKGKKGKGHK